MRAATGRLDPERDLDTLFVQELEVRGQDGSLPVALDGEVVELAGALRYRVRPGALRVLAPAAPS